jgi:phosphatidylserine/phosphatidylglycerophosphate/cardiolipin synthase-like enzyme
MIITHGSVQKDVMELIDRAQKVLVLVSPYLAPWKGLSMAIQRAHVRGVAVQMILRGGDDREKQASAVAPLRPYLYSIRFVEYLHAKVYLSEQAAVLTSMNLLESSALNSVEFAVYVSAQQHPDGYHQAVKVCESLIATAEQDRMRDAGRSVEPPPAAKVANARPLREARQQSTGYCIRCHESVPPNPEKPLCADCYQIWSKYKDPDYGEECCHQCGRQSATSLRKPLCKRCYDAAA